jgi:hypothetical protein
MIPDDVLEAVDMAFSALYNQQCDTRDHGQMEIYYDALKVWRNWLDSQPTMPNDVVGVLVDCLDRCTERDIVTGEILEHRRAWNWLDSLYQEAA